MWGSLKNQDGCESHAFRCYWTVRTCSLLRLTVRGLLGGLACIPWSGCRSRLAFVRWRAVRPSGFVSDCAYDLGGDCRPRLRLHPCAKCLAGFEFPGVSVGRTRCSETVLRSACFKETFTAGLILGTDELVDENFYW